MGSGTTPLAEQARSIFTDLGYVVDGDGPEFRAERAWKVVHVSTTQTVDDGDTAEYRCFVAEPADVDALERRLERRQPAYEWAIIVADGDEYQVERAPPVLT
ncbi:hypothetical protein Halru_1488 [Halovivax ruber XH-70]|uniref:Uncharacterized protein n=1 Tax=Halovivax ruber (strain DSM 18193 / JCM 13892 / XH-70) TaxID=797302 RepID=L0ICZ1_HALRX|nr:hypothetical protein [Halovivax ruber]AGB16096.1 hypothetical protein Halru_1488 [Halovivax ruber XH-70]